MRTPFRDCEWARKNVLFYILLFLLLAISHTLTSSHSSFVVIFLVVHFVSKYIEKMRPRIHRNDMETNIIGKFLLMALQRMSF